MTELDRADVVIYTQGWMGDHPTSDGQRPLAQLHGRVFVNGIEIPRVSKSVIVTQGADFASVELTIILSTVLVSPLNKDAWDKLGSDAQS